MSDEPPAAADFSPSRLSRGYQAHSIGEKCFVLVLDDGWICCRSAKNREREADTRGNSPDKRATADRQIDSAKSIGPAKKSIPSESLGKMGSESVIYFKRGREGCEDEVLIVTPGNLPFKSFAKGHKRGASKCFDERGDPVPEILLLYALKTNVVTDRLFAMAALPIETLQSELRFTSAGEGLVLSIVRQLAGKRHLYEGFVGRMMARAASSPEGLATWIEWESIADRAVVENQELTEKYNGARNPDFDAMLLMAVKETTLEHSGLPALNHVRERWIKLGGRGDWESKKNRHGFDWLPSEKDWDKAWPGTRHFIFGDCITRQKASNLQ